MHNSPQRKTRRTKQRHRALDVVFEADIRGELHTDDLLALLAERKVLSLAQNPIDDFGAAIVEAYATHRDEVDELIAASARGWSLNRMPVVDRTILRLAIAELVVQNQPVPILVGEYSMLARELSTDKAIPFITGVINAVADSRAGMPVVGVEAPEEDALPEGVEVVEIVDDAAAPAGDGDAEATSAEDVPAGDEPEGEAPTE